MKKRIARGNWRLWAIVMPLALLATACLPSGIRIPQSEFSAALERKSGLIAYLGTDGNIYTIDQGGGAKSQLTTDAFANDSDYRFYGIPVWSPDSQRLAFDSFVGKRGDPPSSMSLYTAHKDGSNLVEAHASSDLVVFYYWAPDGKRLGFISQTANNSLSFKVVPPEGGEARLVDAGNPYYWTWSPDGTAVLAHAGGTASSQGRLSLLQLDPDVTEYGLNIEPTEFKAPAFSPDGSKVLVAGRTDDDKTALLLTDALGGDPKMLTEYAGSIAFVWSPDGKRVAYLVSADGSPGTPGKVTIIDPTGKAKPVTLPDEDVYAFFWSPDSKSLALFIEQPQEATATEATATPNPDSPASDASSNNQIIWGLHVMDARSGKEHKVATFLATERFLQVIPYFDQYDQSLTIWSPDSKNLVVSAYRRDGTPGVWVVAASGNLDPRYIADGWMAFWSWK